MGEFEEVVSCISPDMPNRVEQYDHAVEAGTAHFRKLGVCDECSADMIDIEETSLSLQLFLSMVYHLNSDGYHVVPLYKPDLDVQATAKRLFHSKAK